MLFSFIVIIIVLLCICSYTMAQIQKGRFSRTDRYLSWTLKSEQKICSRDRMPLRIFLLCSSLSVNFGMGKAVLSVKSFHKAIFSPIANSHATCFCWSQRWGILSIKALLRSTVFEDVKLIKREGMNFVLCLLLSPVWEIQFCLLSILNLSIIVLSPSEGFCGRKRDSRV